MKKIFIALLLLVPLTSFAITVPWNKVTAGKIYPPIVTDYVGIGTTSPYAPLSVLGQVVASYFTGTTTSTSTFAGGVKSPCFSNDGTNCITGSSFSTSTPDYIIYNEGGLAKSWKTATNAVISSNASADVVLAATVTNCGSGGCDMYVRPGTYYLNATTTFAGNDNDDDPTYTIRGAGNFATKFVVQNNADGFYLTSRVHVNFRDFAIYLTGAANGVTSHSGASLERSFWKSTLDSLIITSTSTTASGWGMVLSNDLRNTYGNIQFLYAPNCLKGIAESSAFNSGDSFFSNIQCNLKTNTVGKYAYYFDGSAGGLVNQNVFEDVNASNDTGSKTAWYLNHTKWFRATGLNVEGFATTSELYNVSEGNAFAYNYVIASSTGNKFFTTDSTSLNNSFGCAYVDTPSGAYTIFSDLNTDTNQPNVLQGVGGANCKLTGSGTFAYSTTSASVIRDVYNTSGSNYLAQIKNAGERLYVNFASAANAFISSASSAINFATGGSVKMTLDSTGKLGIGTTSPVGLLELNSTDSNTTVTTGNATALRLVNTNTTANNLSEISFTTNDTTGTALRVGSLMGINLSHTQNAMSGALALLTRNAGTFAERARLDSNGNFGIGTTSPYAPLSVVGQIVGSYFTGTTTSTSTFAGGVTSTCFSNNGTNCITGIGVSSLGVTGSALTGAVIIATSSTAFNGLTSSTTVTCVTQTCTFANTMAGLLTAGGGGTGISNPTAARVLLGSYAGGGWQQIATSSLGLFTTDVAEGTNQYYTTTRFDNRLSATTSLPNLYALAGLGTFGSTSATTTALGDLTVTRILKMGSGTTTGVNGIDISAGCYSVLGTCLTSGGGGSGYATVQDEGTPLTQRTTINFVGSGVSVADTGGVTTATINAGAASAGGSNTQVQFNDSAALAGADTYYLKTTIRDGFSTTTPAARVQISASSTPQIVYSDPLGGTNLKHIYASTTRGGLAWGTLGDNMTTMTEGMRLDTGGNLGVGTSTPWAKTSITGTAGANKELVVASSTNATHFLIDQHGHVISGGPLPTIGACGTSPSIWPGSTDVSGLIQAGSGTAGTCSMTFANAWTADPICTYTLQVSALAFGSFSSSTRTTLLFTAPSSGNFATNRIAYHCIGLGGQ